MQNQKVNGYRKQQKYIANPPLQFATSLVCAICALRRMADTAFENWACYKPESILFIFPIKKLKDL